LALVLGKGAYSFEAAKNNNFTPLLCPGVPVPSDAKFHGYFFQAKIAGKSVVCLNSEFHPKLQTAATTLFLEKTPGSGASPNFNYVVTSGTAGGIWAIADVDDVIVTNSARYGMTLPKEKQALR
jgi:nucleoside phosphorylase